MSQEYNNSIDQILFQTFNDDGIFPNSKYPVILYKDIIDFSKENGAVAVETLFQKNGWGNSWRNGVYGFHHYHSTAHEVLGIYSGSVRVQLGGETGKIFELEKGDIVIIPAGVAHKNLGSSSDFSVVGAYPKGQSWDMNYGKQGERPAADKNIKKVPLPEKDPVFGDEGPVFDLWSKVD